MAGRPGPLQEAGVTPREAEVLRALGARLTNAEIAEHLFISIRTVESHVSSLLRKLDQPDRLALGTVAARLTERDPVAVPAALVAATSGPPFVGRTDELARVLATAGEVRTHTLRRMVLVTGPAGVGKTRIAAEAAVTLHAAGAVVLHGRCEEDALVPFQAFVDATGSAVAGDAYDVDEGRHRLFEEYDEQLRAAGAPVVFVIDDLQWIDPSGLRLLRHVLHHVDRSPLLILATGRPEVAEPRHPVIAALAAAEAAGTCEHLSLAGLSLAEAGSLAEGLHVDDSSRVRVAWERTDGNPFLLAELLRHGGEDPARLPTSARDAIARRVAGLGSGVVEVLTAAAVAGEVFDLELLSAAIGGDPQRHASDLDRAFGAGLVRADPEQPGRCRFVHAVVRDALLGVTSPARRATLHLALAEALEERTASASPDVARHRHAALPAGVPSRAMTAALDASDRAMAQLAYEVAASFADMAVDAIDAGAGSEADRAEALLRRGRARLTAGDLESGVADCRAALALADRADFPELTVRATLAWADASALWGRDPALRTALENALRRERIGNDTRALIKARLAQVLYYEGDAPRRAALSSQAIADARSSGSPETLAQVLSAAHVTLSGPSRLEERTGAAREMVAAAAAVGHAGLEARGLGWLAVDLLETGDVAGADEALARHAALAEQLRQRLPLRDVQLWASMRAVLSGRYGEAEEALERARELGEAARDPSTATIYWVQRYWLAVERGDPEEMGALVEPCHRIVEDNTDVPAWRAALALLHVRRGDLDAAAPHYERLAADDFGGVPRDAVWLNAMTYLAETCAALDDTDRARALLTTLEPYAERVVLVDRALACKGAMRRFLGLLAATAGETERAAEHLQGALELHRAAGAAPLADRTERELATVASTYGE